MFKELNYIPPSMKRDLISMLDVKDDLKEIIDLGIKLKNKSKNGESIELLKGKTLGMIFEKSSTRTRASFEVGINTKNNPDNKEGVIHFTIPFIVISLGSK